MAKEHHFKCTFLEPIDTGILWNKNCFISLFSTGNECRALEIIDCNTVSVSCSGCPKKKEDSTQKQQVQLVSVTQSKKNPPKQTNHVTRKESY